MSTDTKKRRARHFLTAWSIAACSLIAASGIAMGFQHLHYSGHRSTQLTAQFNARNRERLWSEASGTTPIPNNGDNLDKLAAALKPDLMKAIEANPGGLKAATLPDAIATASAAQSTYAGVNHLLGWCIFDETGNDSKVCRDYGPFNIDFKAQVQDIISGNLYPHLHQVVPVTYNSWGHPSRNDLFLWWLLLTTIAYVVGLIADDIWTGDHDGNGFPNLFRDGPLLPALVSPLAFGVSTVQNVEPFVVNGVKVKIRGRNAIKHDKAIMADHPRPEMLDEAKRVLAELSAIDAKHRADPDIARAIDLAKKTVKEIEEIPEMIRLDEDRITATELLQRLIPIREDAMGMKAEHKALMASIEPELQKALNASPAAPQPIRPDGVTTGHNVNLGSGGNGGGMFRNEPDPQLDALMAEIIAANGNGKKR